MYKISKVGRKKEVDILKQCFSFFSFKEVHNTENLTGINRKYFIRCCRIMNVHFVFHRLYSLCSLVLFCTKNLPCEQIPIQLACSVLLQTHS
jgi:hypothetical protein